MPGVARGGRMGSCVTKETHQSCQLLNLSGHDFMSLPFHFVGNPGRHVLCVEHTSPFRADSVNPQLGATWHQSLSSDGSGPRVELCLHSVP